MCMICAGFNPFVPECPYSASLAHAAAPGAASLGSRGVERRGIETSDAPASTATPFSLALGGFFHGGLTTREDIDYVAVNLTAGEEVTFAATGIGALNSQVNDTRLVLRDASGTRVASADDVVSSADRFDAYSYAHLTTSVASSGRYYIEVSGRDSGSYGLSAELGTLPSYDAWMGAGTLLRPDLSWSLSPGTGTFLTWAARSSSLSENAGSFQRLTAPMQDAMVRATAAVEALTNVTFQQAGTGGTSNFAIILVGSYDSNSAASAYAYYPGSRSVLRDDGDIWLNRAFISGTDLDAGTSSYGTVLHELGHALGLAHPSPYDAIDGNAISYGRSNVFIEDSLQYTVMSYFDPSHTGGDARGSDPDTFLLFDILALQQLYGADWATNSGNTTYGYYATDRGSVYDFDTNTDPFLTIWDGGGTDTIDVSRHSGPQRVDLRDGTFSDVLGLTGTLSIAIGAVIENAAGGDGNDVLIGNEVSNVLRGNAGNDRIASRAREDTLDGGRGEDSLFGEGGFDTLNGGAGRDSLDGGHQADHLFGGADGDRLDGGLGLDWVFGGTGRDLMLGGAGNDRLHGNDGDDTLSGGADEDRIFGHHGDDVLRGGSGNDTLFGGADFDTIHAGSGDDLLFGNFNADIFVIADGHGNDTIADFDATNDLEKIDLRAVSGLDDLGDVIGAATQSGRIVKIETGDDATLTLIGVSLGALGDADFIFD